MFPISDNSPMLRTPIVTIAILAALGLVWVFVQGAGLSPITLSATICNLGLVPGELTGRVPVGTPFPMGRGLVCVIDRDPINAFTPLTSMFLHGGWGHLLGNSLYLWVFGKGVEDGMGRIRYLIFYLLCGLAAAATQVAIEPASGIPMVGASGAISGVLGAYLVLYPRVRVNILLIIFIFIRIIPIPAWIVLALWIVQQIVAGLPELSSGLRPEVSSGVAVWAHIGGFFAGVLLVKLFADKDLVERRRRYLEPRRWRPRYL
jgi:membrane associated rhomboid family serine protease